MHKTLLRGAVAAALLAPVAAVAATNPEIAELRSMLNQMKSQYEGRIRALEARLAKAEAESARSAQRSEAAARRAEQAVAKAEPRPMTAPAAPAPASAPAGGTLGALTSGTAFNPQISVILDGNYYQDGIDGAGSVLVGEAYQPSRVVPHAHGDAVAAEGHSHGAANNGFNFTEAEIAFSATVDPYFDAALYLAVDGEGAVDLEEGWFQTRSLPYGLRLKGGKFLSDFGYINKQHPHQWDFADQNLPYLNLLGDHGLQDTGVQVTWLPRLPFYTLIGAELAQGEQERFGATLDEAEREALGLGGTDSGPRLWTAFAKVAPDLGERHALQLGVSYAHNRQHQEIEVQTRVQADGEVALQESGLDGDASLWGLDLVYKYDGDGAHGHRDFKFQTEYLRAIKDLEVRSSPDAEMLGSGRTYTTDGLYAQAVYGLAPKWTAGLRYDVLGLTNEVTRGDLDEDFGSSDRWTLDVTWNLSEFSRLRAQYARNDILAEPGDREHFDAFYLQFLMSLGSHGAHTF